MTTRCPLHPCPGCDTKIAAWQTTCPACYQLVPAPLWQAHHAERRYCTVNRLRHTDKLLALRAQIRNAVTDLRAQIHASLNKKGLA